MLDFKELPKDGIKFEQMIRELLIKEGFETRWTGIGQDGGRDLIIIEKLKGRLSTKDRKWIVSCKHKAHSGRSVNREELGNIPSDCSAIGAEGYILVCSTYPSSSLVTRLEEVNKNHNIITRFWDSIEIENRLLKPQTFELIHTFFPISSQKYQWKVYNTHSPTFWCANFKEYFLYLSSRYASTFPDLNDIEKFVNIFERVKIFSDIDNPYNSHILKIRAVYFDDKHSTHTIFLDYLFPKDCSEKNIKEKDELKNELNESYLAELHTNDSIWINQPSWDIRYVPESFVSDNFDENHKQYYLPFIRNFETGSHRGDFFIH